MSKAVRVEGGLQSSVSAGLQELGAWRWEGRSIHVGLRGLMRKMFRRNQPDPEERSSIDAELGMMVLM